MSRALSYMMIGALGTSAVWLFLQNKDEVWNAMHQLRENGMRQINKVKAHFE